MKNFIGAVEDEGRKKLVRKDETKCHPCHHHHHPYHHHPPHTYLVSKVDLLAILPYFVSFVMEELKVTLPYDKDKDIDKGKDKDKDN